MPSVKIRIGSGKPWSYSKAVIDSFYRAMRDTLQAPEDRQFVTILERQPAKPFSCGVRGHQGLRDDEVHIQISLLETRTAAHRDALIQRAAELLALWGSDVC